MAWAASAPVPRPVARAVPVPAALQQPAAERHADAATARAATAFHAAVEHSDELVAARDLLLRASPNSALEEDAVPPHIGAAGARLGAAAVQGGSDAAARLFAAASAFGAPSAPAAPSPQDARDVALHAEQVVREQRVRHAIQVLLADDEAGER